MPGPQPKSWTREKTNRILNNNIIQRKKYIPEINVTIGKIKITFHSLHCTEQNSTFMNEGSFRLALLRTELVML
jgi:hypothetical protein